MYITNIYTNHAFKQINKEIKKLTRLWYVFIWFLIEIRVLKCP